MKRAVTSIVVFVLVLALCCGCKNSKIDTKNIGKAGNTVITVYSKLNEIMTAKKKTDYNLYGVRVLFNKENTGAYTYVFTNKRPDELKYSDILIVKVNNRTGEIEHFGAPDFATYGQEPYDMIKSAVPLDIGTYKVDSDKALKITEDAFFRDGISYNYTDIKLCYKDGAPVYSVDYISIVDNCIYSAVVDAVTGTLISKSKGEL